VSLPAPTFLSIGAQRAGTTWLYQHLRRHPRVWLPPIKELNFFNSFDASRELSSSTKLRSLRYDLHLPLRVRAYGRWLARKADPGDFDPAFDLRYFTGAGDIEWYRRLFAPAAARGLVTGDISPSYALLEKRTIETRVLAANPDVRVIYTLRDPVERILSHIGKRLKQGGGQLQQEAFAAEFAFSRQAEAFTDYAATIEAWRSVVGAERLKVLFFDDLAERPHAYLREVMDFIGVDPKLGPAGGAVNAGKPVDKGPLAARLYARYLPQLEKLADAYGGAAQAWLERARAATAPARP
jgi:hypothetical protein